MTKPSSSSSTLTPKQLEQRIKKEWFNAAEQGQLATLKMMIEDPSLSPYVKSFPNLVNEDGRNALMISIGLCHAASAEYLFSLTDWKTQNKSRGWTALIFAIYEDEEALIEKLIPVSSLKAVDRENWTPLMHAAYQGNLRVLKALLPGSDLLAVSDVGENALMLAVGEGHFECVQLLAPLMPHFKQVNKDKQTVMEIAASCSHGEIKGYLLALQEQQTLDSETTQTEQQMQKNGSPRVNSSRKTL